MFSLLKEKISSFVGGIGKKAKEKEKKIIEQDQELEKKIEPIKQQETQEKIKQQETIEQDQELEKKIEPIKQQEIQEEIQGSIQQKESTQQQEKKQEEIQELIKQKEPTQQQETESTQQQETQEPIQQQEKKESLIDKIKKSFEKKPTKQEEKLEKKQEKSKKIKLSISSSVKKLIFEKIKLSKKDIEDLLEELFVSLLESDVEYEVAERIKEELYEKLYEKEVNSKEVDLEIKKEISNTLLSILNESVPKISFLNKFNSFEKPIKIMFIGLNGAGKTTTIAKISKKLNDHGFSSVLSASDTFRSAAIEQIEKHANNLSTHIIKGKYGSDPTSIAFDSVNYAKKHKKSCVLIDTAGRQDTNVNLLDELSKMCRIINPDISIYVCESIAGSSAAQQIRNFENKIKIDGIILTKLDCDPKGGSILSITKMTGIPIYFIGTGQKYSDLIEFNPEKIAKEITN